MNEPSETLHSPSRTDDSDLGYAPRYSHAVETVDDDAEDEPLAYKLRYNSLYRIKVPDPVMNDANGSVEIETGASTVPGAAGESSLEPSSAIAEAGGLQRREPDFDSDDDEEEIERVVERTRNASISARNLAAAAAALAARTAAISERISSGLNSESVDLALRLLEDEAAAGLTALTVPDKADDVDEQPASRGEGGQATAEQDLPGLETSDGAYTGRDSDQQPSCAEVVSRGPLQPVPALPAQLPQPSHSSETAPASSLDDQPLGASGDAPVDNGTEDVLASRSLSPPQIKASDTPMVAAGEGVREGTSCTDEAEISNGLRPEAISPVPVWAANGPSADDSPPSVPVAAFGNASAWQDGAAGDFAQGDEEPAGFGAADWSEGDVQPHAAASGAGDWQAAHREVGGEVGAHAAGGVVGLASSTAEGWGGNASWQEAPAAEAVAALAVDDATVDAAEFAAEAVAEVEGASDMYAAAPAAAEAVGPNGATAGYGHGHGYGYEGVSARTNVPLPANAEAAADAPNAQLLLDDYRIAAAAGLVSPELASLLGLGPPMTGSGVGDAATQPNPAATDGAGDSEEEEEEEEEEVEVVRGVAWEVPVEDVDMNPGAPEATPAAATAAAPAPAAAAPAQSAAGPAEALHYADSEEAVADLILSGRAVEPPAPSAAPAAAAALASAAAPAAQLQTRALPPMASLSRWPAVSDPFDAADTDEDAESGFVVEPLSAGGSSQVAARRPVPAHAAAPYQQQLQQQQQQSTPAAALVQPGPGQDSSPGARGGVGAAGLALAAGAGLAAMAGAVVGAGAAMAGAVPVSRELTLQAWQQHPQHQAPAVPPAAGMPPGEPDGPLPPGLGASPSQRHPQQQQQQQQALFPPGHPQAPAQPQLGFNGSPDNRLPTSMRPSASPVPGPGIRPGMPLQGPMPHGGTPPPGWIPPPGPGVPHPQAGFPVGPGSPGRMAPGSPGLPGALPPGMMPHPGRPGSGPPFPQGPQQFPQQVPGVPLPPGARLGFPPGSPGHPLGPAGGPGPRPLMGSGGQHPPPPYPGPGAAGPGPAPMMRLGGPMPGPFPGPVRPYGQPPQMRPPMGPGGPPTAAPVPPSPYPGLLYTEGRDTMGRPVVVLNTAMLPAKSKKNDVLQYVLQQLQPVVQQDYVLVVLSLAMGVKASKVSSTWALGAYRSLAKPYRKNVKHIVLVQPSAWARALLALAQPFVSKKAAHKIKKVDNLVDVAEATSGEVRLDSLGARFIREIQYGLGASPLAGLTGSGLVPPGPGPTYPQQQLRPPYPPGGGQGFQAHMQPRPGPPGAQPPMPRPGMPAGPGPVQVQMQMQRGPGYPAGPQSTQQQQRPPTASSATTPVYGPGPGPGSLSRIQGPPPARPQFPPGPLGPQYGMQYPPGPVEPQGGFESVRGVGPGAVMPGGSGNGGVVAPPPMTRAGSAARGAP